MAVVGEAGLLDNQPPLMPHEFPLLPVASGLLQPEGAVVVFTMADELSVTEPYVPDAVETSDAVDDALNGPLLVEALAV